MASLDPARTPEAGILLNTELQEIAEYASEALGAPIALVTAIGTERQTLLARVGLELDGTSLEDSFLVHAVLGGGVFEVPDTLADPRFQDNPLVTGEPHVRFYAGVPVRAGDGPPTHALCVLDTEPRTLTDFQRKTLVLLARQVEAHLALCRQARELDEAQAMSHRSAELVRMVTDRLPVRIAYVDREFRFRFVNDAYVSQVGLTRDAAIGRTLAEALGEPMFLQARPNFERAFAGETHTQEFDARYDTGVRPIRATYVPDLDAHGEVIGVVLQVIDLTEQRASEAAVRASEAHYRGLFESVDDGFCTFEMLYDEAGRPVDYRFLEVNDAFVALTGLAREDALGGRTMREMAPTHERAWFERYGEVARTGVPLRIEDEAQALGRWYEIHAFRVGGEGSRVVGALFKDVTQRHAAERERERLVAELAEARGRLDAVLAAAEVGVWDYDPTTGRIGGDANLGAMFGLDPGTARQAPAEVFVARIHPEDQAKVAEAFGRAAAEGAPYDVEYRTVVEGRVRHLVARGFAERDAQGRVVRMPGAVLDVTSTKAAQEAERAAQETFRTVFEQAPDDAILVMDPDRTLTAWNPAAERICGWSAEEAIGQAADVIFTPEDRAKGVPGWETTTAAREGKVEDERWHLRKDGSRFWGSGTMNSLHNPDGSVRGFLKVFRDATERHEVQTALRASEERFRAFQETTPNPFAVMEAVRDEGGAIIDFRYVYVNAATERLTGDRVGSLVGSLALDVRPALAGSELFRTWVRTVEMGEPFSQEITMDYPSGRTHMRITGARVGDGVATAVVDLTERFFNEERLRKAVEERTQDLERAVTEAEGFNYSISHDLRTPLRAMASTSSVLLEDLGPELSEPHRELLQRQSHNAARMGRLIDDLLRLSRLARAEVRRERVDLTAMARSVAQETEGTYAFEVQEGMAVEADPGLLRTVLQNLIENAFKFSPEGGTVRVGQDGAVCWVRDEGIGFDPAHASRIFVPFERLVADDAFPGTGIGLANVKRIVERHGGRVWFESEPGKGATFLFTLG